MHYLSFLLPFLMLSLLLHRSLRLTIRCSTWARVSTAGGQAWEAEINATKTCLQALQESRAAHTQVPIASNEGVAAAEGAGEEVHEKVNLEEIEPNIDVPEAFANVMIEEHAHISIRSD